MTELPMPTLLGVCGRMHSGKDTLGDYLVREQGYTRVAFADKVKEAIVALDPIVHVTEFGAIKRLSDYRQRGFQPANDESAVELCNRLKNTLPEVRRLMQAMGNDVGQGIFGKMFWIMLALREATKGRVVITDVRYPHEAEAIRELGGRVLRVSRPNFVEESSAPSEMLVEECKVDYDIVNDGTISEYLTRSMEALTRD